MLNRALGLVLSLVLTCAIVGTLRADEEETPSQKSDFWGKVRSTLGVKSSDDSSGSDHATSGDKRRQSSNYSSSRSQDRFSADRELRMRGGSRTNSNNSANSAKSNNSTPSNSSAKPADHPSKSEDESNLAPDRDQSAASSESTGGELYRDRPGKVSVMAKHDGTSAAAASGDTAANSPFSPPDPPPIRSLQERLSAVRQSAESNAPARSVAEIEPKRTSARTFTSTQPTPPVVTTPSPSPSTQSARSENASVVRMGPKSEAPAYRPPAAAQSTSRSGNSSSNVLFTRQSPVIAVETAGPRTITIGKEATYLITLRNAGDVAAQDVVVNIKIPDSTDVVGAQPTTGTTRAPTAAEAGEAFQWRLARLESRGSEQLALRLVPRKSRPFDLAVQWTCSPAQSQALVEVQEPKLVMTMSGPDEVMYGQTKIYKLTISNPGSGDAENVVVSLWPLGDPHGVPSRHPMGTIRSGDSRVAEVEVTARQSGALAIKAAAAADGGLTTESLQDVLVRRAGLAFQVEAPKIKYAGTAATYRIHVTNSGNAPAEDLRVIASLPQGSKFQFGSNGAQLSADQSKVMWTLQPLRPGEEAVLELKCGLNVAGSNRLQVMGTAFGDLAETASAATEVQALADLKLEVLDPQGPAAVGDEVSYELHVRNRGSKAAEDVDVVTFFGEGIEPVAAQGGQHEITAGQVVFKPIPLLAPGGEVVYKIRARGEKAGNHAFRTEVRCGALGTKLVSEESTMFYGDDAVTGPVRQARTPKEGASTPAHPSGASRPAPYGERTMLR